MAVHGHKSTTYSTKHSTFMSPQNNKQQCPTDPEDQLIQDTLEADRKRAIKRGEILHTAQQEHEWNIVKEILRYAQSVSLHMEVIISALSRDSGTPVEKLSYGLREWDL